MAETIIDDEGIMLAASNIQKNINLIEEAAEVVLKIISSVSGNNIKLGEGAKEILKYLKKIKKICSYVKGLDKEIKSLTAEYLSEVECAALLNKKEEP